MSHSRSLFGPLLAAAILSCGLPKALYGQAAPPNDQPGKSLLADSLIDDARLRARSLPAAIGLPEMMVLSQAARQLHPNDPTTLRLLATSALASGHLPLAREAFKAFIAADPTNLVAQVDFLDLLAQGRPVEEQINIFAAALARETLDPQVRSEVATRLGRLMIQRGDLQEATRYLQTALSLNDVNVGAWQEMCLVLAKTNAKPEERMSALVNLLWSNPYQPEGLTGGGYLLSDFNAHALAADWLISAQEQIPLTGYNVPPTMILQLANELVSANRLSEAQPVVEALLTYPQPPVAVTMLAALLEKGGRMLTVATTAPAAGADAAAEPAATQKSSQSLVEMMRSRSAESLQKYPTNSAALEEWLWTELYFQPTLLPDTEKNLETFKSAVGATAAPYQRMYGWLLIRQNKLDEAKGVLTPIAGQDGFALLGLVRIAQLQKDSKTAAACLLRLWGSYPTGILAAIVTTEARLQGVLLPVLSTTQALLDIARKYPDTMLTMQRRPRDLVLIQPSLSKVRYDVGEPVWLKVDMLNATERALYAGPGGAVPNSLALGGNLRGVDPQPLGIFALENAPRIYRLERRATLSVPLRVDQGMLHDMLCGNPARYLSVGLFVMTNPRQSGHNGIQEGLGGMSVPAGEFTRTGFSYAGAEALTRNANDLATMPLDQQMNVAAVLEVVVYNIPEGDAPAPAADAGAAAAPAPASGPSYGEARKRIIDALLFQLQHGNPVTQAWMLRYAPFKDVPLVVLDALDRLSDSPDPLVRMAACTRLQLSAGKDMAARAKIAEALRKRAQTETDPLVHQWALLLAQESALDPSTLTDNVPSGTAAGPPATAPATP